MHTQLLAVLQQGQGAGANSAPGIKSEVKSQLNGQAANKHSLDPSFQDLMRGMTGQKQVEVPLLKGQGQNRSDQLATMFTSGPMTHQAQSNKNLAPTQNSLEPIPTSLLEQINHQKRPVSLVSDWQTSSTPQGQHLETIKGMKVDLNEKSNNPASEIVDLNILKERSKALGPHQSENNKSQNKTANVENTAYVKENTLHQGLIKRNNKVAQSLPDSSASRSKAVVIESLQSKVAPKVQALSSYGLQAPQEQMIITNKATFDGGSFKSLQDKKSAPLRVLSPSPFKEETVLPETKFDDLSAILGTSAPKQNSLLQMAPTNQINLDNLNVQDSEARVELVNKISDLVSEMRLSGKNELKINVQDKTLGDIDLKMTRDRHQGMQINLSAMNESTVNLIKSNQDGLLNQLNQLGVKVSEFNVDVSAGQKSSNFGGEKGSNGQSFAQSQNGTYNNKEGNDDGSQRRQELWDHYRERMSA